MTDGFIESRYSEFGRLLSSGRQIDRYGLVEPVVGCQSLVQPPVIKRGAYTKKGRVSPDFALSW